MLLAGVSGAAGFLAAYGLAAIVNMFPLPEMFPALPVKAATTVLSFAALAVIAIGVGGVAGVESGVADTRGGAAV